MDNKTRTSKVYIVVNVNNAWNKEEYTTNIEVENNPQWGEESCRNPNLAKCGGEAQHLEKLGIWSPPGLPNVQSSTAGPKTPRIGVFLVSLERS